jgi:hypothetical protein
MLMTSALAGCEQLVNTAYFQIDETSDLSVFGSLQRVGGSLEIVLLTNEPTFALSLPALSRLW